MENYLYDNIEEFGTKDILFFYYAQKNNLWGILDIDYEELIPCRYAEKPDLAFFDELFKSKVSQQQPQKLFYPDYYAYEMVFKAKNEDHRYAVFFIQKQLMPEVKVFKNFSKHTFDDLKIDTKTKEIHVSENGTNKTYTFGYFEEHYLDL
ncbi:hypothetical protein ACE01N_08100 [Saccharicrinis sp. FJH2]|uniref:hypothetical protein n=1 Tax=Saccharicrinis sp. FJH65 TaxID=3344659 RepID=UPI0035F2CA24